MARTTLLLFFALAWGVATAAEPDRYFFAVVVQTEAIERLEGASVFPWEVPPACDNCEFQPIVVSHSCGMVEARYVGLVLDSSYIEKRTMDWFSGDERITVRAQLGEWCRFSPYDFAEPTLLHLAESMGNLYVLDYAPIFYARTLVNAPDDYPTTVVDDFVADRSFLDRAGLTDLASDLNILDPSRSDACYPIKDGIPDQWDAGWLGYEWSNVGEHRCLKRGVLIEDILD